jgi:hypothetical protein
MSILRVCSILQTELSISDDDREWMIALGLYFRDYFLRIGHTGLDWVCVYIYAARISKNCKHTSWVDYDPRIHVPLSVFPGLLILLFAMILTDKFHNDLTVPNTTWRVGLLRCLKVNIRLKDFNRLERFIFSTVLDWDFLISPDEYNTIRVTKELYVLNDDLTCNDEKEFELELSSQMSIPISQDQTPVYKKKKNP